MNKSQLIGYEPKCKIYQREQTVGKKCWYIDYYLSNGKRVRRFCDKERSRAKRIMHIKEQQLYEGNFGEKDFKYLDGFILKPSLSLPIDEAIKLYLSKGMTGKTAKTRYNDELSIRKYFGYFKAMGRQNIQDIKILDVQGLVDALVAEGKALPTTRNAVAFVKKVFNWLIDVAEIQNLENPAKNGIKFQKEGSLVRNRVPSSHEVLALLEQCQKPSFGAASVTPVKEVITFLIFTGARLGEALHAEWEDFDLEQRFWFIKSKPDCPTKEGMGWSPKWHKERVVPLFPEAIDILKSLNRRDSIGYSPVVIGDKRVMQAFPANFVFTKQVTKAREDGNAETVFSRVDSLKKSWATLKKEASVTNLQIKDIRTFFNCTISFRYGFSPKESSSYIGNSQDVNQKHYAFPQLSILKEKMSRTSFSEVLALEN